MSTNAQAELSELLAMPARRRVDLLVRFANGLAAAMDAGERPENGTVGKTADALLDLMHNYGGPARERMAVGEALGRLGDPRLRSPEDPEYWVRVEVDLGELLVGRYPVTIAEWQAFVGGGGYQDEHIWDPEWTAWMATGRRSWPELAARPEVAQLVIPNQPVVGITWWEARAYARLHNARLPSFLERLAVVRGPVKRPYPWGEPFGQGNANTAEEVLGKPCAVGLYEMDRTPDGVCDLAGNVAEWTDDEVGDERVIAPGSWEQSSMASWAKARDMQPPAARLADLGFRLVRDP